MSDSGTPISPKWGVIKRSNGHAECTAGPIIQLFDNEPDANAEADSLMAKHHGVTFAVFRIISQRTILPQPVVETVVEETPAE